MAPETIQQFLIAEGNATTAAKPFGLHLVMCPGNRWAVWYVLRPIDSVPAEIMAGTITMAYQNFTQYVAKNGLV